LVGFNFNETSQVVGLRLPKNSSNPFLSNFHQRKNIEFFSFSVRVRLLIQIIPGHLACFNDVFLLRIILFLFFSSRKSRKKTFVTQIHVSDKDDWTVIFEIQS